MKWKLKVHAGTDRTASRVTRRICTGGTCLSSTCAQVEPARFVVGSVGMFLFALYYMTQKKKEAVSEIRSIEIPFLDTLNENMPKACFYRIYGTFSFRVL